MTPKTENSVQNQRDTKPRTIHTRTEQNITNPYKTYQPPQRIPENKYNPTPELKKRKHQQTEHEIYQQNKRNQYGTKVSTTIPENDTQTGSS